MASAWLPPVPPWSPTDKSSFAFQSVAKRWPTIITSAIDALYQASHALSYSSDKQEAEKRSKEAKVLIERLSKLKHDMGRDKPLEVIGEDGGDSTEEYDRVVERNKWTWFTAPWLFAECYLYRLLRSFFARSAHWKHYDPFSTQKVSAFRSSSVAIQQLSETVEELITNAESARKDGGKIASDQLQLIFREIVQTSLWGNSSDLSLLTNLKHADLQELQAAGVGAEAQAKRETFILSGMQGIQGAWNTLMEAGPSSRVDIILDNSGFELFTDLLLADVLLATGRAAHVCFHPKDMPWFVSDVTPADFFFTIEALQSGNFFRLQGEEDPGKPHESSDLDASFFLSADGQRVDPIKSFVIDSSTVHHIWTTNKGVSPSTATQRLATRWANHLQSGAFEVSISPGVHLGGSPQLKQSTQANFWTSYHNFPSLPLAAPKLFEKLQDSALVISKGDLNYRKWCSDARWTFSEPFENVLGPVKGSLNLLVLRTNKADVCVGVPQDRLATLDSEDMGWRTNGKYAMIEFVSKL